VLFEQVLNLVRRYIPAAAIAFSSTPADTFDAAARLVEVPGRLAPVKPRKVVYERLLARVRRGNEFQDSGGGQVLLIDPYAEG
jgi:hypothetical protein